MFGFKLPKIRLPKFRLPSLHFLRRRRVRTRTFRPKTRTFRPRHLTVRRRRGFLRLPRIKIPRILKRTVKTVASLLTPAPIRILKTVKRKYPKLYRKASRIVSHAVRFTPIGNVLATFKRFRHRIRPKLRAYYKPSHRIRIRPKIRPRIRIRPRSHLRPKPTLPHVALALGHIPSHRPKPALGYKPPLRPEPYRPKPSVYHAQLVTSAAPQLMQPQTVQPQQLPQLQMTQPQPSVSVKAEGKRDEKKSNMMLPLLAGVGLLAAVMFMKKR